MRKIQEYRKGKRIIGNLYEQDNGELLYVVRRKLSNIYKGGNASISHGIEDNTASWGLDENLLFSLRAKGITQIAFHAEDTDDLYMIPFSNFFDIKVYKAFVASKWETVRKRYVPVSLFQLKRGKVDLFNNVKV